MSEPKNTAEICIASLADARAAAKGGACRVELNSALSAGGLSPSLSVLKQIKNMLPQLKVICMVRCREGGFVYSNLEMESMLQEAEDFLKAGADGLAFGFLKPDGRIDETSTRNMIELIHKYNKEAVFHRAFDLTPDPRQALTTLINLQTDRVLTSGQQPTALAGASLLQSLQDQFGDSIEILAGSGVTADNAAQLLKQTGVHQLHSSCRSACLEEGVCKEQVSFAMDPARPQIRLQTDPEVVAAFVKAVEG